MRVSVVDRGVGLTDEQLPRMFEPFYTTKPDGMGLGLAICQTIMNAHDGTVDVERNAGQGTTFSFSLPVLGREDSGGNGVNGFDTKKSEWVAQTVEACGHAVIVADPNYALMYGHRSRQIKTDQRDVAALVEACRLGIYRAAHRVSAVQREARRVVRIREQLVRMRTQTINQLRAQLRQEGIRLASGSAETVVRRLDALARPRRAAGGSSRRCARCSRAWRR